MLTELAVSHPGAPRLGALERERIDEQWATAHELDVVRGGVFERAAGLEQSQLEMKSACMEVVGQHFRPEFVNRVDDVVVFHPLGREEIRKIVDIQLAGLERRLAEREIGLRLTDAARDRLGEAGFDPVYGARPLKRAIQTLVENPLAEAILRGEFGPGSVVEIDVEESGLSFLAAAA